jgi:hypothetical protein
MEFTTRQELIKDLSNNYEHEGVVLTIKTSKEKRVVMKCDRGGEYVNMLNLTNETHQRETHTRRTGYEFEIVCSSMKGVWAICKISGSQNHELGGNLAGHAVKCRLSKLEKVKVRTLGGQGLASKDILYILRKEFANSRSIAREIYNELVVARVEELKGHKPIKALVELISYSDYFNKVRLVEGAVDCVFFMHQSSISMC